VEARSGSAASLLTDGRILFTGGTGTNGPLATTEFFNTDGSFSPGAPMQDARANHTAVVLQDGRVLVAGGTTVGGGITNTAEIYDPSANIWTLVPVGMIVARSGHSASLLSDGRVLIAGGQTTSGTTNTLEIFSPATGSFALVTSGTLSSARVQHAAAVLQDGRVLIAGGSNGTNPLGTADIFDPSSGSISAAANISTPRASLSATTLLDGTVLIAGGNNGTVDLASAEIYNPAAGTFSATGNLVTTRSGHLAFLLPNNNEVLIAGGTSAGVALQSAELFVPWTSAFSSTGALSVVRIAAAGNPLKQNGQLLIAGGSNGTNPLASAELYGFTTVTTDASDYPPGTTVNISGSGWQPGETVTLTLVESPLIDTHGPFSAVADSNGNIFNNQFVTDEHDENIRFYLTAKGSAWQAQNTFTDSNVASVGVGSQTPNPVAPNNPATYQVSVMFSGNNTSSCTADLSATGLPSGASAVFSLDGTTVISVTGIKGQSLQPTLTITPAAGTAANSYSFTVKAAPESNCNNNGAATASATLVVGGAAATNLAATSAAGTYGGTTTLSATLTSGSSPVNGKSISFTLNGISVGSATTNASGVAQLGNVSLSGINAGTYTTGVAASFAGDASFQTSSGTASLTVSKATLTAKADDQSKVYGAALPTLTGTLAGVVNGDAITATYGTVATAASPVGTYAITVTLNDPGSKLSNYNVTTTNGTLTVSKATLTAKADDQSKVYGAALPTLTGTLAGVVNGDAITATYGTAATAASPVGTYAITVTLNDPGSKLSNYNVTTTNGTLTVNPAPTSIMLTSAVTPSSGLAGITLTAAVSSSVLPFGSVTFVDTSNNASLGTATLDSSGRASVGAMTSLSVGTHLIKANYTPGSTNFLASTSVPSTAPTATITAPTSSYDVFAISTAVNLAGTFTDATSATSPSAVWTVTNPSTSPVTNSTSNGTISASSITGSQTIGTTGVYNFALTFTDGLGGVVIANTVGDTATPAMIVIYDPSAGFVTGGGWINSPIGADTQYPSLTGKATFGFVSKYQHGATVPTGDTEFQFQTGNLDFHSTAYQWLVISGGMAQYKGTGTINGSGTYNFLLTACDGNLTGNNTPDGFRIKITDSTTGNTMYDNLVSTDDTMQAKNTEALGGGRVIIHGN
jgi:hypothetical protein